MGKLSSLIRTAAGKRRFCSAVILAAGKGTRFSSDQPKQYFEIDGKPVLLHSALAFEHCELIDEIIVVTSETDTEHCRNYLIKNGVNKLTRVVAGGETRQASAKNGFNAVNPACAFVAVHDAARCLVTPEMIEAAFESAFVFGGAACAAVCTDTLKRTDISNSVKETVDRTNMWLVQTPQVFDANMYRAAQYYADKDGFVGTDDCSICERLGFNIKMVDVGRTNIKITYPEDIVIAEAILRSRRNTEDEE